MLPSISKIINKSAKKPPIAPVDLYCLIEQVPTAHGSSMVFGLERAIYKHKNKKITIDYNRDPENDKIDMVVNNTPVNLIIITTAGREELTAMRESYYQKAKVYILLFSFFSYRSLLHLADAAEIIRRVHNIDENQIAPIILVGYDNSATTAFINDDELLSYERQSPDDKEQSREVGIGEVKRAINLIKPAAYIPVDVKAMQNLDQLLEEAVKVALEKRTETKLPAEFLLDTKQPSQNTSKVKNMLPYPSTSASSSKKAPIAPIDLVCLIEQVPKTYDHSMAERLKYVLYKSKNKEFNIDDLIFNNEDYKIDMVVNNKSVNFKIITTSGQDEFSSMKETYYKEASVYILLFSFFEADSLSKLYDATKTIRRVHDIDENQIAPIILASYDNLAATVFVDSQGYLCSKRESPNDKERSRQVDINDLKKIINLIKPAAYIPADVNAMQNLDQLLEEAVKVTLEKRTETKLPAEFLLNTKQQAQSTSWFKKMFSQDKPTVATQAKLPTPNNASNSRSPVPTKQPGEMPSAQAANTLTLSSSTKSSVQARTPIQVKQDVIDSLTIAPDLEQYQIFLQELPTDDLEILKTIKKNGGNLNQMLLTLSQLKTNQTELQLRLETVEIYSGLDAQTQAEITYIQKNENLNRYYQALKMLLEQTFLAAKVIASGEVNATKGMGAAIASVIIKMISNTCPITAPFAVFATLVSDKMDAIDSYRSMQTLSNWVAHEDLAKLAAKVARELVIAQEYHLARGLTPAAKKILQQMKEKCSLLLERIHSGKKLTIEQEKALLDAKEILTYMKENEKPRNANLDECATILMRVIMGEDYEHDASHIVAQAQQADIAATPSDKTTAVITATEQPHVITREEWEAVQKEAAQTKKAMESTQKELERLRKQTAKSNSNSSYSHDNGDTTVSLQEQMVNTSQGPMPISTLFKSMQTQLAALEGGMSTTNQIVYKLQETLGIEKDDSETPNEQMRNDLLQGSSFSYSELKK